MNEGGVACCYYKEKDMTVQQMISELSKMDPNLEVKAFATDQNWGPNPSEVPDANHPCMVFFEHELGCVVVVPQAPPGNWDGCA